MDEEANALQEEQKYIEALEREIAEKKKELRKLKQRKKSFCEYVNVPELDYYDCFDSNFATTDEERAQLCHPHLDWSLPASGEAYVDLCKLARKLFKGKYEFKTKKESLRTIAYRDQRKAASFINQVTKLWNKYMLDIYGDTAPVLEKTHRELIEEYWENWEKCHSLHYADGTSTVDVPPEEEWKEISPILGSIYAEEE